MFRSSKSERPLRLILYTLAACTGSLVALIFLFLIKEAWPVLRSQGFAGFFQSSTWAPTEGLFNLVPMLAASLMVTSGALMLAFPLGLLSAIFCHFYAPPIVASIYRRLIEILAGIPSVVYGFWGLMVLVPSINQWQPPGASLLAGILILALMILPTVALTADASITAVPSHYLTAAYALGLDKLAVLRNAVWPAAKGGFGSGALLATGRALGETMAMIMVCGNIVQTPASLFDPVRTLTANIALEMAYAMAEHRAALFASGFLLVVVIAVLVACNDLINRGATP